MDFDSTQKRPLDNWLLRTKLNIPSKRPGLIARPYLLERLHKGLEEGKRLSLVSAAAGFGKTTLVVSWIEEVARPTCWLSLDDGDNDLARFFYHLAAALEAVDESIGRSLRELQHTSRLPSADLLMTSLINDIDAIDEPFMLVLEDYQVIKEPQVHAGVAFLLEHQPKCVHLVIATRRDPPLPLAKLRGHGQITEIRSEDLRFSAQEASEFLNIRMGLDVPTEDLTCLLERTEGWIAGLHLVAISLKAHSDHSFYIRNLTGDDRFLMDYLVDEVLALQSEHIRSFLLHTSIVDRFSAPLCDELMRNDANCRPSQEVLEYLERANLFIVPLDSRRGWYRYHQLFGGMLRRRLQVDSQDKARRLHQRASQWFEKNGSLRQAVKHALNAGDFARAADLIEGNAEQIFMRGEFTTFLEWLDTIPDDDLRTRPRLRIYYTLALLLVGKPIERVQAAMGDSPKAYSIAKGELCAVQAILAYLRGDLKNASRLSAQAQELVPASSLFMRGVIARTQGALYKLKGDIKSAERSLLQSEALSEEAGDLTGVAVTKYQQAELQYVRGCLDKAANLYQAAIKLASNENGPKPLAGRFMAGLADIHRERNQLNSALQLLRKAINLTRLGLETWGMGAQVCLARVRQALGDSAGAIRAIEEAQRLAIRYDASEMDDVIVMAYRARLMLQQGKMAEVYEWAEVRNLFSRADAFEKESASDQTSYDTVTEFELIAFSHLLIAEDQGLSALAILEKLLLLAKERQRIRTVIEIYALLTLTHYLTHNRDKALDSFSEATNLAAPQGFVRIFVDLGDPMEQFLRQASTRHVNRPYVQTLLSAFAIPIEIAIQDNSEPDLPYAPISLREMEVLRLLNTHLNGTEIANELSISVNTAKFHIKNIYAKLGAHSRSEAIALAIEHSIL